MRVANLLVFCCITLLANGCSKQEAAAPPVSVTAAVPDAALEPKIVVQLGHQSPVLAVRWVDGGRHLVSLASDGSIVIWNVASGTILDHAQVPLDPQLMLSGGDKKPVLRLHAFSDGPVANTLAIAYVSANEDGAKSNCPAAHHVGTPWCTYSIDLATRLVRADAGLPIPAADEGGDAQHWPLSPDGKLRPGPNHGNGRRGLPDTSDDHFGDLDPTCTSLQRCRYGVTLLSIGNNNEARVLTVDPRGYFLDADLSSDGLRLLRVVRPFNASGTRVEALDLSSGNREPVFAATRAYHQVRWHDEKHYLLSSEGYSPTNDTEDAVGFPPALLVDAACAARGDCSKIDSRWQMRPVAGGALVALGSLARDCYGGGGDGVACFGAEGHVEDGNFTSDPPPTGLAWLAPGALSWQPMAQAALAGEVITAIEPSPDRRQLAVATRVWDRADAPDSKQVLRVWLLDIADGAATAPRKLVEIVDPADGRVFADAVTIRAVSFSADARRIVFTHAGSAWADFRGAKADAKLYIVDTDAAAKVRTISGFSRRAVAIGDDRVFGLDDGTLLDLDTGRPVVRIPSQSALVRAGWIERSRLLWTSTEDGAILFRDSGDGTLVLTLHTLPDNRYFAVAPGGRYDTNLGADSALVRWVVPDAPWRSLAAQTFMRDYFEPGLYRKLLDCRASDSCKTAFKPLPAVASLNRVLPEVRITGVRAGRDAAEAVVAIEVREGVDTGAPNGKTRSGLYNPRLFRNGKLVAVAPRQVDAANTSLAEWRTRNAVKAENGVHQLEFTVPLSTQEGEASQVFTAYAFNEDRIKGETATLAWTRAAIAPRPRRAYVLTIGIDDYDTPRFRLNYAVADAKLMASRLSTIPGYETKQLLLAAERGTDGRRKRVDRASMVRVLSLLASNANREATLAALRADGIDASMLQAATPDDAVIVSFSGHGWANPRGEFYLIPGDGRWPDGSETPDLSTVFATADLVAPFQAMQANEITLVIDACHSAASVSDGRFKPGPMGDSGLGQLAYDKGIRILAATQADDVALEDARLGQGLLTYALAVDGLGAGHADLDVDGRIRIDEWLAYAVARMPTLANDTRVGRITAAGQGSRAITFHDLPANASARRVQQPALFDFNAQPSKVLLRKGDL